MTPNDHYTAVLSAASPAQLDSLDQAHWRYITLIGLVSDVLPVDQVQADQIAYPQFISQNDGMPVFNDDDCTTFMVAVTGLSSALCEAWRDKDFYDLHGETAEEMASRQNA